MSDFIVRGSSAGVYRNGEFLSDSDTACPRRTWLRHKNVQEKISKFTEQIFNIGFQFENYFGTLVEGQKEVEVNTPNFGGHADLVTDDCVYETKSVTSKNTYKKVFKEKTPKSSHLIQLCHYLIQMERQKGKLVYGSFLTKEIEYGKLKKMRPDAIPALMENAIPEIKEFLIEISDDGFILVDGEHFENLHVSEFLDFIEEVSALINANELPPRVEPLTPNAWGDVCKFCPFLMVCDSNPTSLEDFTDACQDVLDAAGEEY
jgi:CRISPR/Cas system-associated exonuclease Cas4 (RecB family)